MSWDDGNESNEFVEASSEGDVGVDEKALAKGMTLDNIPTTVAATPYVLVPPLNEHVEDNSWTSWACDTTYNDEGEFQKGMTFDNIKIHCWKLLDCIIFVGTLSTKLRLPIKLSLP